MDTDLIQVVTGATTMPTKQEVYDAVINYTNRYVEGEIGVHPLKEYLTLKRIELFVTEALKQVQPWALQEAKNYSKDELKNVYNTKIVIKSGTPTYDYSINEDWMKLYLAEEEYKKQVAMSANDRKALEKNMLLAGTAEKLDDGKESITIMLL